MKPYNVGILGCGEVWQRHRLAFDNSERIRCTCVYDPARGRAEEAAALTGARVADSEEAVLTADDVDIVAILTPVFTHAGQVAIATAAGKHLMLEKPMALTNDEGQRIVDAIGNAGVKCFHPTLRALASDLFAALQEWTTESGAVGPVLSGFYHLVGVPVANSAWMLDRAKCFPPAEYDPHVLDTFLNLTDDEPASVWCHAGRYCRPFEQDDVTNMVVRFRDGGYLQIDVHWCVDPDWTCGSRVSFDLVCERGLIRHNWFSAAWFSRDGQGEFKSTRQASGGDRWDHYHALIDAIENDTELSPNELDGLRYGRINDAALRSARSGETVFLGE